MIYSRIAGTGSYLPEKVVTNFDLEKIVDTTDEWIRTRTGIERRHIAADGETTVDLAEHAARRALEAAGVAPARRRLHRLRHHHPGPGVSQLRRAAAGSASAAAACPAFSVETACSGFMYALSIADKYVRCGRGQARAGGRRRDALAHHRLERPRHRGAVRATARARWCSSRATSPGILSHAPARRRHATRTCCTARAACRRASARPERGHRPMAGNEVFKVAVTKLGERRRRGARGQRPGPLRDRLAGAAPGQHPHHPGDGPQARPAHGAGDRHRAGSRQHLGRLGAAGAGCRRCATGASSAASCCCWRPSAAASPGARRWCATRGRAGQRPAFRDAKKTPRRCAAFFVALRNQLLTSKPTA